MNRFKKTFELKEGEFKQVLFSRVRNGEMRRGEAILRWIEWHGMLRCGEIIRFVCEMNGRDYDLCEDVYVIEREDGTRWNLTVNPRDRDKWYTFGQVHLHTTGGAYVGKLIERKLESGRRVNRGYYCTPLFGSWKKKGLLERNCEKKKYGSYSYYVVRESVVNLDFKCSLYEDRKGSWW